MANIYSKIPLNGFGGFTAQQLAEGLQREFYRISRPPEIKDPNDVTEYLSGWMTHPQTGQLAIVLPDVTITKHNLADASRLIDFLKSVINQTKQTQVRNYWRDNKSIPIQELWEFLFPNQTLTHAEMEAEGWFVTEEV